MIEAQNLTRRYGDFTAVHGISFSVNEGEIVGMLGPNGAGKTTTIRMITGFLPPTGGRVTVAGKDLFESPREARQRIGEALSRCLLDDVRGQIIGTLSNGYRQRVGLATAILHRPSTLVLDEPTVGLDPKQIIAIRELIRELGRQRTLLLSTHILPEVELLCNRVMIIDRGRIVAEGTPEELRERSVGNPAVRVTLKNAPDAVAILGSVPGVAAVHPGRSSGIEGGWLVEHTAGSDPREEIFRAAVARGWVLLEMARERTTLEDIFVRLTTHDQAAEAAAPETPVAVIEDEKADEVDGTDDEEIPS